MISNDSYYSEMSLKREISRDKDKDISHHNHNSINYNSNRTSGIISNKIMSTFKDYEDAIQSLSKINSIKANESANFNNYNYNSMRMIFNDPRNKKTSLFKHNCYSTLLEEKDKLNTKRHKDTKQVSSQGKLIENDLRRQLELKNEEIEALREKLELAYNLNIDDLSLSYLPNREEDNMDKSQNVLIQIQELSNELKCKNRALERLKEKDALREKEIEKFYLNEMNMIKETYEKTIKKLNEGLVNKDNKKMEVKTVDQFHIIDSVNGQRYINQDIIYTINNDLSNQIAFKDNKIQSLQKTNEELKLELYTIVVNVNELTKCKLELEEELINNKAQIEDLLKKNLSNEKELQELKETNTKLNTELVSQRELHDKTVSQNKIDFDTLKDKVDTLSSQKACIEEELYQCRNKYEQEKENAREKEHQITELNYNKELLEQENNSKVNNDIDININVTHEDNLKCSSSSINSNAKADNTPNDSNSFFNDNSKSINDQDIILNLPSSKIIVNHNIDYFNEKKSDQEAMKQLKEEHTLALNKKDEEINTLIKQIENITESCKILKKINKDKNDIILDLKIKLTKSFDMKTEFEKQINHLKEDQSSKSNTIAQLEDQLNQCNQKITSLQSDLESKCSAIALKNNQIDNLSTISLEQEKKINSLANVINDKEDEIAQIKLSSNQLTFSKSIDDGNYSENNSIKSDSYYIVKVAFKLYAVLMEKRYKEMQWYLVTKMNKNGTEFEGENYSNTYWIEARAINDQLMIQYQKRLQKEKEMHKQLVTMLIKNNNIEKQYSSQSQSLGNSGNNNNNNGDNDGNKGTKVQFVNKKINKAISEGKISPLSSTRVDN